MQSFPSSIILNIQLLGSFTLILHCVHTIQRLNQFYPLWSRSYLFSSISFRSSFSLHYWKREWFQTKPNISSSIRNLFTALVNSITQLNIPYNWFCNVVLCSYRSGNYSHQKNNGVLFKLDLIQSREIWPPFHGLVAPSRELNPDFPVTFIFLVQNTSIKIQNTFNLQLFNKIHNLLKNLWLIEIYRELWQWGWRYAVSVEGDDALMRVKR